MNSVPEAVFLGLIAALTIAWLWRELLLQYVITVAVIMAAIGALACVALKTSWWLPLIVLNSRGAGRFLLRNWQDRAYYGWWLIGLTCLLSLALSPNWTTPTLALLMQLASLPWLIKRRPENVPSYLPLLTFGMILAGALLGFFMLPL